jgi:hypothetical protein
MQLAERNCRHYAVYWEPAGTTDDFGQNAWIAPREIRCRIERKAQEFLGPEGREEVSKAKILVLEDLRLGGMLTLDTELANITDAAVPKNNPDTWEIRSINDSDSIKNDQSSKSIFV